jgi:hypothetical protein
MTQQEREEGELLSSPTPEVDPPATLGAQERPFYATPGSRVRPLRHEDIERRFNYHRPEGQKVYDHDAVRQAFKQFANYLNGILPAGREASVAFTELESASMWAQAAIARDGK